MININLWLLQNYIIKERIIASYQIVSYDSQILYTTFYMYRIINAYICTKPNTCNLKSYCAYSSKHSTGNLHYRLFSLWQFYTLRISPGTDLASWWKNQGMSGLAQQLFLEPIHCLPSHKTSVWWYCMLLVWL